MKNVNNIFFSFAFKLTNVYFFLYKQIEIIRPMHKVLLEDIAVSKKKIVDTFCSLYCVMRVYNLLLIISDLLSPLTFIRKKY